MYELQNKNKDSMCMCMWCIQLNHILEPLNDCPLNVVMYCVLCDASNCNE